MALLPPLLLAGCGDYPRPFMGAPGATALRLAQPPPARLAVPAPDGALLTDAASQRYAQAVTAALADAEVPAFSTKLRHGDWTLVLGAELRGSQVVPTFDIQDPKGKSAGVSEGSAVPAAAWSAADPATLQSAAQNAAASVATLLTRIEAIRRQSDPNSLYNRPARVWVPDVTGAPGDGDTALATLMRAQLPELGEMVQDSASGADFTLRGNVVVVPGAGGMQRVEITWTVTDARGEERGKIVQLNEVPPGTLDHHWGDVAMVVAQEAAGGVKDVILQQSGRRAPPVASPPASAPPASAPPTSGPPSGPASGAAPAPAS